MCYMMACFNYRAHIVVIGSHPYPDHIVTFLGSSYSQQDDTVDTPTTRIIAQHFDDDEELESVMGRSVRESWKTIVGAVYGLMPPMTAPPVMTPNQ